MDANYIGDSNLVIELGDCFHDLANSQSILDLTYDVQKTSDVNSAVSSFNVNATTKDLTITWASSISVDEAAVTFTIDVENENGSSIQRTLDLTLKNVAVSLQTYLGADCPLLYDGETSGTTLLNKGAAGSAGDATLAGTYTGGQTTPINSHGILGSASLRAVVGTVGDAFESEHLTFLFLGNPSSANFDRIFEATVAGVCACLGATGLPRSRLGRAPGLRRR
jgi:hypothetical protein